MLIDFQNSLVVQFYTVFNTDKINKIKKVKLLPINIRYEIYDYPITVYSTNNKAGQRGCTYVFLMSECAFLFHIETVNDPSSERDNTPITSSSAIRPLLR